jgi:hypothetical protein
MNLFKESADIKTADMLNLPTPEAHYHTVAVKPSEQQKGLVASLSERARIVHERLVDPHEDNMLTITSDGRKIGLDQRLINPFLPDEPSSKVTICAENIYRIWEENKEARLTQLMFCDFSTPSKDKFNVYDDIRDKLIAKGVPEKEIAYIHDADNEAKKKELFAKVRKGQVRVLMGSTAKMGAGTNVQDHLIAIHDLDCPWRPADLAQRAGRIVRQGNKNPDVHIYRYVTEGTFDSYLYQTLENKQKFISQIMTSKNPVRSCEDVDESVLSYAEIKALCTGNPLIREKMNLDVEVGKLRLMQSAHKNSHYEMEDQLLKSIPRSIAETAKRITGYEKDLQEMTPTVENFAPMTIFGKTYAAKEDMKDAGEAILAACQTTHGIKNAAEIGTYRGFTMTLTFNPAKKCFEMDLKNEMNYRLELGDSAFGNITRINNALNGIPEYLEAANKTLQNLHQQAEDIKIELSKPFEREEELRVKSVRLSELDSLLNMDASKGGINAETEKAEELLENSSDVVVPSPVSAEANQILSIAESLQKAKETITVCAKTAQINIVDADTVEEGKVYKGKVLEVTQHHVVQLRNSDIAYIHEIAKFSDVPKKGENFTIAYRAGLGNIQFPQIDGHRKEREMLR